MGAPTTVYQDKSIHTYNNGEVINSRAVIDTDKSTILNRFYLDDWIVSKDSTGNDGFSGLVYDGGVNASMHNTSRIGSLRAYLNGNMHNFTDAGLNTLPYCTTNSPVTIRANDLSVSATFKSAYYVSSTAVGILAKKNSESFITNSDGFQVQNTSTTRTLQLITFAGISAGDTITYKAYNENAEGIYYGAEVSFTVKPAIYQFFGGEAYASYAITSTGDLHNYYFSTAEIIVGTIVYTNDNMTTKPASGYYASADRLSWYKIEQDSTTLNMVITQIGSAGNYDTTDPAHVFPYYVYQFVARHSARASNACGLASTNPTSIQLFQSNPYINDKYWNDAGLTDVATNGYYVVEIDEFTREWKHIVDGFVVEIGSC